MVDIDLSELDFSKIAMSKEELKAWIEEHKDKLEEARELWLNLETRVVSAVENPSHPSKFVALKSEDGETNVKTQEVPLLIDREKSEEKQIAFAPAMVPDTLDGDGDIVPQPIVEKAAHGYLEDLRNREIDADHETPKGADQAIRSRGTVIESWTLKDSREYKAIDGDVKEYPKGTWMIGVQFKDETWDRIKSGEIQGYSIMGTPRVLPMNDEKGSSLGEETLKGSDEDNNSMSESEETEDTETVHVELSKEELVESITNSVKSELAEEFESDGTEEQESEESEETEETETEEETEEQEAEEEEETEETEDEKSLKEFVEEKDIDTQDLIQLIASQIEKDVEDVEEAINPLVETETEEEEETEETEAEEEEEESEEEKEETEETEKSVDDHNSEIERLVNEIAQPDGAEKDTEKEEEETDPIENVLDHI